MASEEPSWLQHQLDDHQSCTCIPNAVAAGESNQASQGAIWSGKSSLPVWACIVCLLNSGTASACNQVIVTG